MLSHGGEESRDRLLLQRLIRGLGSGTEVCDGEKWPPGPRAGLWHQGRTGLGQRMDELGAWQDKGQEPPGSAGLKPSGGGCRALTGARTGAQGDYTRLQLSNKIIPAADGDAEGHN